MDRNPIERRFNALLLRLWNKQQGFPTVSERKRARYTRNAARRWQARKREMDRDLFTPCLCGAVGLVVLVLLFFSL